MMFNVIRGAQPRTNEAGVQFAFSDLRYFDATSDQILMSGTPNP